MVFKLPREKSIRVVRVITFTVLAYCTVRYSALVIAMSEKTLNMLREVKVILSLLTRTVTELEIRLNPEVVSQAGDVTRVGLVDILEPLVKRIVTSTLSLKTCEQGIQFSQLGKQHGGRTPSSGQVNKLLNSFTIL